MAPAVNMIVNRNLLRHPTMRGLTVPVDLFHDCAPFEMANAQSLYETNFRPALDILRAIQRY
jgi:hypothetical protein